MYKGVQKTKKEIFQILKKIHPDKVNSVDFSEYTSLKDKMIPLEEKVKICEMITRFLLSASHNSESNPSFETKSDELRELFTSADQRVLVKPEGPYLR